MPYRVRKQKCTRSDGKKGSYVLKYKPKKPTKKKKDSDGFVKAGCHTSKKKAHGQRAAIEGGPINAGDEKQEAILEWLLGAINENKDPPPGPAGITFPDGGKKAAFKYGPKTEDDSPGGESAETPTIVEDDNTPHLASYKAPQGSKRDKQLDQTKKDLKKAKELRKKGKAGEAKELEQRAYKRRDRMERQYREKNENLIREMVRKILMEELLTEKLSKATEDKIRKKAEERGYTFGSMKAEYKKGLAAFASSGSRPGMTAHGWAMARINKCTESQSWSGCKKSKAKKKK